MRRAAVVAGCVVVLVAVPLLARSGDDSPPRVIDPHRCVRALDSARAVISIAARALDVARRTVGSVPSRADVAELTRDSQRMDSAAPRWQRDAQACRAGAR